MARTKSDAYVKASAKSSRKQSIVWSDRSQGSPKNGKSDKYAGGNPYCPRPTPAWQKPITSFFTSSGSSERLETSCITEPETPQRVTEPVSSGSNNLDD